MLGNETISVDYENFTCSICGLVLDKLLYHWDGSPLYKYCPNCGARMEAENENGKASVERATGEWIKCDFHDFGERVYWNYKCTNCEAVYSTQYNYCPDCGTKMKQEAENEKH